MRLLIVLLVILTVSCSKEKSDGQSTSTPTPWVEDAVGYRLLLPSYLPHYVTEPTVRIMAEQRVVEVRYRPIRGREGPSAPDIVLRQNPGRVIFPDSRDDPSVREMNVAGTPAVIVERGGPEGPPGTTAFVSIFWYQNSFAMSADFAWLGGQGERLELTDDMREVAVKVVGSIISDPDMSTRH